MSKRSRLVFVILVATLGVRGDSEGMLARTQQDNQHRHASGATPLPVAVSGAETPERIPDDLAYIHFISSVSIKKDAPQGDVRRRKAILAAAGLADYDAEALIRALDGVRERLNELDDERKQIRPEQLVETTGLVRAASLRMGRRALMDSARDRVLAALSADGFTALHEHVQRRVKPRIVIYGDPRP